MEGSDEEASSQSVEQTMANCKCDEGWDVWQDRTAAQFQPVVTLACWHVPISYRVAHQHDLLLSL